MSRNSLVKDKEHSEARTLYQEGKTYNDIVRLLGVSKSSVSLWCRDLVRPRVKKTKVVEQPTERKSTKPTPVEVQIKPKPVLKGKSASAPFEGYLLYEYRRGDGLFNIQLTKGKRDERLSMSRARYNMSVALGRRLGHHELVLRKSDDLTDDRVENLKVVIRGASRVPKIVTKECKNCQETFQANFTSRRYCPSCQEKNLVVRSPPKKIESKKAESECVICEKTFTGRSGVETCSKRCRGKLLRLIAQENNR